MANPHEPPTALKGLQDSVYREKVLRARDILAVQDLENLDRPCVKNGCAVHGTSSRPNDILENLPKF